MTDECPKLTPEQEAQIPAWREKWAKIGTDTTAISQEIRDKVPGVLAEYYTLAELSPPRSVVWVRSPYAGAAVAGVASYVLRNFPTKDKMEMVSEAMQIAIDLVLRNMLTRMTHLSVFGEKLLEVPRDLLIIAEARSDVFRSIKDITGLSPRQENFGTLDDAVVNMANEMISSIGDSWEMRNPGNHWPVHAAGVTFYRYVVGRQMDYTRWEPYEWLTEHTCWRYVDEEFAIMVDRPCAFNFDPDEQHHCETGPAIEWRDGFASYLLHGVLMKRHWIEKAQSLDVTEWLSVENQEQRTALATLIGWPTLLEKLGAKQIAASDDPQIGSLHDVTVPWVTEPLRFLKAECPTGKTIAVRVPPTIDDPLEAGAWTYGLSKEEYAASEVRT